MVRLDSATEAVTHSGKGRRKRLLQLRSSGGGFQVAASLEHLRNGQHIRPHQVRLRGLVKLRKRSALRHGIAARDLVDSALDFPKPKALADYATKRHVVRIGFCGFGLPVFHRVGRRDGPADARQVESAVVFLFKH